MKVTYILGNGFDLNFGLKSSYHDFYKYYVQQDCESDAVDSLKKRLRTYLNEGNENNEENINWSDLELALGKYTTEVESVAEYILLLRDINKHLNTYLTLQNKLFNPEEGLLESIVKDFMVPVRYLYGDGREFIEQDWSEWIQNGHEPEYNVLTFNYTLIAEQIIGLSEKKKEFDVLHIHGVLGNAILGLNSVSQIHNTKFQDSSDLVNRMVKPIVNSEDRGLTRQRINDEIMSSNYIVVFGASLGPTDEEWGRKIGEALQSDDTYLLYFTFDDVADTSTSTERCVISKKYKQELKNKLGLSEDIFEDVQSKIFIGCNTELFKGYKVNQPTETMFLPNYSETTITK